MACDSNQVIDGCDEFWEIIFKYTASNLSSSCVFSSASLRASRDEAQFIVQVSLMSTRNKFQLRSPNRCYTSRCRSLASRARSPLKQWVVGRDIAEQMNPAFFFFILPEYGTRQSNIIKYEEIIL